MNDHMTTRQKQIPNRIDILVSMRGDMSIDSQGAPLNGGKGDIHVEYVRADSIESMTDEELVKRLRERGGLWPVAAADRIEQLAAERDLQYDENAHRIAMQAKAEAERDHLRKALTRLLAPFENEACRYDHHGYCQAHFVEADCCVSYARAALKGENHE